MDLLSNGKGPVLDANWLLRYYKCQYKTKDIRGYRLDFLVSNPDYAHKGFSVYLRAPISTVIKLIRSSLMEPRHPLSW